MRGEEVGFRNRGEGVGVEGVLGGGLSGKLSVVLASGLGRCGRAWDDDCESALDGDGERAPEGIRAGSAHRSAADGVGGWLSARSERGLVCSWIGDGVSERIEVGVGDRTPDGMKAGSAQSSGLGVEACGGGDLGVGGGDGRGGDCGCRGRRVNRFLRFRRRSAMRASRESGEG